MLPHRASPCTTLGISTSFTEGFRLSPVPCWPSAVLSALVTRQNPPHSSTQDKPLHEAVKFGTYTIIIIIVRSADAALQVKGMPQHKSGDFAVGASRNYWYRTKCLQHAVLLLRSHYLSLGTGVEISKPLLPAGPATSEHLWTLIPAAVQLLWHCSPPCVELVQHSQQSRQNSRLARAEMLFQTGSHQLT